MLLPVQLVRHEPHPLPAPHPPPVRAAKVVGATQFIVESIVLGYGYGDWGEKVLTEDDQYAPPGRSKVIERHVAAMRAKEELVFAAEGIDGVALRFGFLYGPGFGTGGTDDIVAMLRKRKLPTVNDHGRVVPWTELTDAAAATVAAVEHGGANQAYNIVDDEPTGFGEHISLAAKAFGTPKPVSLPIWAVRPMGFAHASMSTSMHVSNAKARRDLGWTPKYASARVGIDALAVSPKA